MSDHSAGVPPLIRQGELVTEVARRLVEHVKIPWEKLTYQPRILAPYSELALAVTKPGGEVETKFPPRTLGDVHRELRELMYRPGAGTWFSAEWVITRDGKVDTSFNYDEEPAWTHPAEPIFYVQDLELFPRNDEAIPGWLKSQLELARSQ